MKRPAIAGGACGICLTRDERQDFGDLADIERVSVLAELKEQEQHDRSRRLQREARDAAGAGRWRRWCSSSIASLDWRSDSDRLLRGLAQLRERLGDLLRAGRLRLHAFVDRLDARRQRLHLLDDLRQLAADLLDLLHAAADFLARTCPCPSRRPTTADWISLTICSMS